MNYNQDVQTLEATVKAGPGLVTKDMSVIEGRMEELGRNINILGEEVAHLINRITPIRRVSVTNQSTDLSPDAPEEHTSHIATHLNLLNRQLKHIQSNVVDAVSELEV